MQMGYVEVGEFRRITRCIWKMAQDRFMVSPNGHIEGHVTEIFGK